MKITDIQFFDHTFERPTSETDTEIVRAYSANVAIDDKFMVQLSGNDVDCDYSIPSAHEAYWNSAEEQDQARAELNLQKVIQFLNDEGVENNYNWLSENATERY